MVPRTVGSSSEREQALTTFRSGTGRSSYRPPPPTPENYKQPGALKKYLHARGESFVYLSEDRTEVVSEHPDGSVDRYTIPPEEREQEDLWAAETAGETVKEVEREEREKGAVAVKPTKGRKSVKGIRKLTGFPSTTKDQFRTATAMAKPARTSKHSGRNR